MSAPVAGGKPRRRRLRPEQRRELIVAAAADEFGRRGFSDARLSDIAAAAGTTKPVVYDHFANKEALHTAVLEFTVREFAEAVAGAIAAAADGAAVDRLRAGFEAYFRFYEERPYARLLLFRDPSAATDAARSVSHAQATAANGAAAIYLSEPTFLAGREDRELVARRVAHAVIGACNAIASAPRMTLEEKTDLAMELLAPGLDEMRSEA